MKRLRDYKLITLDFETFYGTKYTLRTMSYTDYIHDPRFKVHMLGVKEGNKPTKIITDVNSWVQKINWDKTAIMGHNLPFDAYILAYHYNVRPAMYIDTLAMARGVHSHHVKFGLDTLAKLHGLKGKTKKHALTNAKDVRDLSKEMFDAMAEYCIDDVEDTYEIGTDLIELIPPKELHVIDIFVRMACQPVLKVNRERLLRHKNNEAKKRADLLEKVGVDKKVLVSNDQFADLLKSYGVQPPTKISPRTGIATWAFAKTDMEFQALGKHKDSRVRDLYEARRLCKSSIEETRTERLMDATHGGHTLLPVFLNYAGAHTLRSSGCLTADTKVIIKSIDGEVAEVTITHVKDTDLVWDGEEFVPHSGVVFSGLKEVITYDGVTGTPDHKVFTDEDTTITLAEAAKGRVNIKRPEKMPDGRFSPDS